MANRRGRQGEGCNRAQLQNLVEDDQPSINAAMQQFTLWREAKARVYVAVLQNSELMDVEGKIVEVGKYIRFEDDLGVVKLSFLPHMFVDVAVISDAGGTTVKCQQSPLGPDLEISDVQKRALLDVADVRRRRVQ